MSIDCGNERKSRNHRFCRLHRREIKKEVYRDTRIQEYKNTGIQGYKKKEILNPNKLEKFVVRRKNWIPVPACARTGPPRE
jgi:hypothetical protein